jgi:ParB family chromosome partitioning protein
MLTGIASSLKDKKQTSDPQRDRLTSGVKAVQKGLDQLSAGAAHTVATDQIADSVVRDRFDLDEGLDELVTSIRTSGQKLPVLLRKTPSGPLPYEVVYGRRRIEACRQLGMDVRAHIVDMSDREALISQGLENAARLQRSFIEQAVYAEQLLDHDFIREDIMEVLATDRTTVSRMRAVVKHVPRSVIDAIGPAHDVGRRPWQQLQNLFETDPGLSVEKVLGCVDSALPSSRRLNALLIRLGQTRKSALKPAAVKREVAGGQLRIERRADRVAVRTTGTDLHGFADFLDERIEALVEEFKSSRNDD